MVTYKYKCTDMRITVTVDKTTAIAFSGSFRKRIGISRVTLVE